MVGIFVASRSIQKLCNHRVTNPASDHIELPSSYPTTYGESIYVNTYSLDAFVSEVLPNIQVPFVLVTGDSDKVVPVDFEHATNTLLNNQYLLHWYAQNCIKTDHQKLHQLPIGIDIHTIENNANHWWGPKQSVEEQETDLVLLATMSRTPNALCYSNIHFFTTGRFGYDRLDAINQIPRELVYYEPTQISRIDTWRHMITYKFVLSPHSNGLDCHRTWEALLLGCIPIVKTSPLDPMYADLPVMIVQNWSDVTKELLEKYVPPAINKKKLTLAYWDNQINGNMVSKR
jgi:hypothetical protein